MNSWIAGCFSGLNDVQSYVDKDGWTYMHALKKWTDVGLATISFGQQMPLAEMQRAEQATLACDLFIAIGSSLVVYPAAGFPQVAKQNGARLIIINNEPTDQDYLCDLVLNQQIGPTLSAAVSS